MAVDSNNLKSAQKFPQVVVSKIQIEVLAGRIAGPFPSPSTLNICPPPEMVQKRPSYTKVSDVYLTELYTVKYT